MIYIITGQTATGKTNKAIELAKKCNGELINCDSRQLYKYLDITTGKDKPLNQEFKLFKKIKQFQIGTYSLVKNVPIWLYDVLDPKMPSNIFDYRILALDVIHDIVSRGKTPIIVGGSYLYLHHLLYNMIDQPIEPDWTLRYQLKNKSVEELQKIITELNPTLIETLNNSEKNNPQRLIRKIEITKKGSIQNNSFTYELAREISMHNVTIEGYFYKERTDLVNKITQRVHDRLDQGAVKEVQTLLDNGYTAQVPGLQTIGYVQIMAYIQESLTYEQMITQWIQREVQYAKRQSTFIKRNPHAILHYF